MLNMQQHKSIPDCNSSSYPVCKTEVRSDGTPYLGDHWIPNENVIIRGSKEERDKKREKRKEKEEAAKAKAAKDKADLERLALENKIDGTTDEKKE